MNKKLIAFSSIAVVILLAVFGIKFNSDKQAQAKREAELYELKRAEIRRQLQLSRIARDEWEKVKEGTSISSKGMHDDTYLQAFCSDPTSPLFESNLKLIERLAAEKASETGSPVPTRDAAIANECSKLKSAPTPSVTVEPVVTPTPSVTVEPVITPSP